MHESTGFRDARARRSTAEERPGSGKESRGPSRERPELALGMRTDLDNPIRSVERDEWLLRHRDGHGEVILRL